VLWRSFFSFGSARLGGSAVLQERVQSSAAYSRAATMGNLKHEVTQEFLTLLNRRAQSLPKLMDGSIVSDLERCIDDVLTRQCVTLLALHIPYAQVPSCLPSYPHPPNAWRISSALPCSSSTLDRL
jgi:hypothetical protein